MSLTTTSPPPRRILILPAAGLGDLVMAAPVIHALRQRFPDAFLAVLAHHARGAAQLGACLPDLDEVIDFPLTRYSWPAVLRFFTGPFWPLLRTLRHKHFDTAVILSPNPLRTILTGMLRLPRCLTVPGRGHPTAEGLAAIRALGCSPTPQPFPFVPPDVPLTKYLPANLPRPWVALHPFSAMPWRRWNHYQQLIPLLQKEHLTVILLGQQPHHTPVPGLIDLVNQLSVTELIALISRLDLLVTCDSGPMHLAFALHTPTVALFGPVPPDYRLPLTPAPLRAIYLPPADRPAFARLKERHPLPINYFDPISPHHVLQATIELLNQNQSGS